MNKVLIPILSLLLIFSSCKEDFEGYELNGQIKGIENQELILQFLNQNEVVAIDTVMTDSIGNFTMKGFVKEKGYHRIMSKNNAWIFLLEDGIKPNIVIDSETNEILISNYVAGEELEKNIQYINEKNKPLYELQYKLQPLFQDTSISDEQKMAANQEYMLLKAKTDSDIKTKIEEVLNEYPFSAIYMLPLIEDIDYVKNIVVQLDSIIPKSIYVINIKEALDKIDQQKIQQEQLEAQKQKQLQAQSQANNTGTNNSDAKEIVMNNLDGKPMKLSDLRGKIVLVDFWASWCRPCRAANPEVVKMYHKYKSKGFDIFSVSLDKSADKWKEAIQKDGLVWKSHVSDLKFWNNAAAKAWGVQSIPATFLLDRDGKVIGRNLRGAALEAKLKEVL